MIRKLALERNFRDAARNLTLQSNSLDVGKINNNEWSGDILKCFSKDYLRETMRIRVVFKKLWQTFKHIV